MSVNRRFYFNLVIVLLIAFVFSLGGLNTNAAPKKIQPKSKSSINKVLKTGNNTFTLIISSGLKGCLSVKGVTILKKSLKVDSKKDALSFLKENSEVIETGGFINYINKIKSMYPVPSSKMTEEMKTKGVMGADWFIYLNNKKTLIGAGAIYPKKGDVIMFDYHYWNKDEFKANNN